MEPYLLAVAVVDREVRVESAAPDTIRAEGALAVRLSYRFEESSRRREGHRFRFWARLDDGDTQEESKRFEDIPLRHDQAHGSLVLELDVPPGTHTLAFGAEAERLLHTRSGLQVEEDEVRRVEGTVRLT